MTVVTVMTVVFVIKQLSLDGGKIMLANDKRIVKPKKSKPYPDRDLKTLRMEEEYSRRASFQRQKKKRREQMSAVH